VPRCAAAPLTTRRAAVIFAGGGAGRLGRRFCHMWYYPILCGAARRLYGAARRMW